MKSRRGRSVFIGPHDRDHPFHDCGVGRFGDAVGRRAVVIFDIGKDLLAIQFARAEIVFADTDDCARKMKNNKPNQWVESSARETAAGILQQNSAPHNCVMSGSITAELFSLQVALCPLMIGGLA